MRWAAPAAVALLVAGALLAAGAPGGAGARPGRQVSAGSVATSTSTSTSTSTTTSTTTTVAPPAPARPVADPVDRLAVAPEPQPRTGYDRDRFGGWADADGDGCDTRQEVLIAESLATAQVDRYGCAVVAGDWFSVYDGVATDQPGDLEIDHVVALAEAWDSGASAWDDQRRNAFANDLSDGAQLVAVTSLSNQRKGDQGPAEWLPARWEARCPFATDWVTVKLRWGLTADLAEVAALRSALATCGQPPPAPVPTGHGGLRVSLADCRAELVVVLNDGPTAADLSGWTVHDEGTKHTFSFPPGTVLASGASASVRSGTSPPAPGELAWTTASVWNNDGDVAYLVGPAGGQVSALPC